MDVDKPTEFHRSVEELIQVLPKLIARLFADILPDEIFSITRNPWIQHIDPSQRRVVLLNIADQPLDFNPDLPTVQLLTGWRLQLWRMARCYLLAARRWCFATH